jgi:hypothetical protein
MKLKLPRMILLSALSIGAVLAQGPGFRGQGGGDRVLDSATSIDRRIAFLKALLTLTDAQVTQATTIYTNAAATITPLQTSLQTARESLTAAVKSNAVTTIDQLAAQIGMASGQILAAQSKADAAFYALLTATQKTTFDAVGTHGPRGGGPGGPDHF